MNISLVNATDIPDDVVQTVLRSINRQINEDFAPYWQIDARVRLEGRSGPPSATHQVPKDLRGDAILYLWDENDIDGALGYHSRNGSGLPYGFVFTELAEQLGEPWSVTLSHEVLEMIVDPHVNLYAEGPHPQDPSRIVLHWYETCDAVQAETYEIEGIPVSNFVLPHYFTMDEEPGSRNDFLSSGIESFGVNKGGYVGFLDPETGDHDTYSRGKKATKRLRAKEAVAESRRTFRRQGRRHRRTERPAAAPQGHDPQSFNDQLQKAVDALTAVQKMLPH